MTNKFKIKRIYAGCYLATFGDEESYIERSMDEPKMWVASCTEQYFSRLSEAKEVVKMILMENASY